MRFVHAPSREIVIDLARGEIPFAAVRDELIALDLATVMAEGFNYSEPAGLGILRQVFVDRFADSALRPDDTLVTAGALSALDLALRSFPHSRPARMVVQEPTYREALSIARALGVPVTAWDTVMLSGGLTADDVVYVVPTLNNPDGRSLLPTERDLLVSAVCESGAALVEDAAYELFAPSPERASSLTAKVTRARPEAWAVRLFSFSKVAVPGARICLVEGTERGMAALRRTKVDFGTSPLSSALIARLVNDDASFACYLSTLTSRLNLGRQVASTSLASWECPPNVSFGGYFVWLETGSLTGAEVVARAARAGVSVADGSPFYVDRAAHHVRLSVAWEPPERIAAGLRVLETCMDSPKGRE